MKVFHEWRQSGLADPTPVIVAAEKLIGQGRPDLALEVLKSSTEGLRVRQLRALALAKNGQRDEAIELSERLRQQVELDAETGGLLAGRYKERWLLTHDVAAREAHPAGQIGPDARGAAGRASVRAQSRQPGIADGPRGGDHVPGLCDSDVPAGVRQDCLQQRSRDPEPVPGLNRPRVHLGSVDRRGCGECEE